MLLSYPDQASFGEDLAAVAKAVAGLPGGTARSGLQRCTAWLAGMTALQASASYVDTFDLRRRRSLYLTYYRYGDTRERGGALAALAGTYKAAGFTLASGELPDFLPALLELAATSPAGQALLSEHRSALGALRAELEEAGSNYAGAVAAVGEALGPLDRASRAALARYRQMGPPSEQVGLGQLAPPALASQP